MTKRRVPSRPAQGQRKKPASTRKERGARGRGAADARRHAAPTPSTPAAPPTPPQPPVAGIYRNLPIRFPALWPDGARIAYVGSASAKIEAQAPPLAVLRPEMWEAFYAALLRYFRTRDPAGAEAFEDALFAIDSWDLADPAELLRWLRALAPVLRRKGRQFPLGTVVYSVATLSAFLRRARTGRQFRHGRGGAYGPGITRALDAWWTHPALPLPVPPLSTKIRHEIDGHVKANTPPREFAIWLVAQRLGISPEGVQKYLKALAQLRRGAPRASRTT